MKVKTYSYSAPLYEIGIFYQMVSSEFFLDSDHTRTFFLHTRNIGTQDFPR